MAEPNPWEVEDLQRAGQRQPAAPAAPPVNNIPAWEQQDIDAMSATGGRLPETSAARAERLAAQDRFWNQTNALQRVGAGVGHLVSSIPVVRHLPGINRIPETQLVRDYVAGAPSEATFSSIAGQSIPFAAVALRAPQAMSMLRYAAPTNAAIEGSDRFIEAARQGRNPLIPSVVGAGYGALATVPSNLAGRLVTPRTPTSVIRRHRDAIEDTVDTVAGRPPNLDYPTPTLFGNFTGSPLLQNEILAYLAGSYVGAHPTASLLAGAAPSIVQGLRQAERRGGIAHFIESADRPTLLGYTSAREIPGINPPINAFDRTLYRYLTNTRISPQNQALLNALGVTGVNTAMALGPDPNATMTGQ